ncbi:protein translocase subunit SecD [Nocardioides sp. Soil805]|uniref:protein translocase subunit SecD n=1 Tax=Nocardioides sp. Soil805 TaxID=1736416 RepID=UPI0007028E4C|nr:protein translocase subunit SecD [Nocardioides sp. Soil805]KRF36167.1 preprotein translocase subunit SecD [Nocardioides sp. Soil805]
MARRPHPGRTLVVFFLGLLLSYGLVAVAGVWTPKLGLDLQGGTRITLIAQGDVSTDRLAEARGIIEDRVNGSGVAEAEVSTQGNKYVVVEIPGESRRDLVETVKRQAQMRFRLVAAQAAGTAGSGTGAGTGQGTVPGTPDTGTGTQPQVTPSGAPTSAPKRRAPYAWSDQTSSETPSPSGTPTPAPEQGAGGDTGGGTGSQGAVDDPLTWIDNPDAASLKAFEEFSCPTDGQPAKVVDDPDKPLVTCDQSGRKLLLSVAMIEGTDLAGASTRPPDSQSVEWGVDLDFDRQGTETFAEISRALVNTQKQFAIVLDGQVISAPTMNGLILDGNAQITGQFTQTEADSLSTSLKYGALPIAFEKDPPVELVGPSLAGNQLQAGITAGLVGLVLVMLYCLAYYRGLGLVVIASLLVAAALTYAMVVLLSEAAGFTLSLPGIAGLIVAVGITADSFIVFFERIRDEMRDGRSMRVAVEAGWVRARNTCLAADAVSLLAAVVLYVFAAGVVKGFAFALGLSTVIDLVVFFWFTKPVVSYLARYPFFNRGHALSGLSRDTLGLEPRPAGGTA